MEQLIRMELGKKEKIFDVKAAIVEDEKIYILMEDEEGNAAVWFVLPQGIRMVKPETKNRIEKIYEINKSMDEKDAVIRLEVAHIFYEGGKLIDPSI